MRFDKAVLVKVIVFSAVCVAMTVLLGVRLANTRLFADRLTYEAEFANAAGVIKGDSVKIAGVDVGRVMSTRIEAGKAIVVFGVDEDVRVPADSRAAIRWRNVLGQRFLYLYPGDGNEVLEEGDRIPVSRTETAGDVGELLNTLGPVLRAIDPEKANTFLESINTALAGNETAARALLDNAASLGTDLAALDDEIGAVLESSDEVLGTFASQDESIHEILRRLDSLGGSLQRTTGDLNLVLSEFSVVQRHLDRLLSENAATIDATLADLESVTGTLAKNKRRLARTLCTLPIGVAGYFQTTSWGEWFNVRITEVIFKDPESNTIFSRSETPQQRAEEPPTPAFTDCGKETFGTGGRDGSKAARAGVSDGPEALVRFLLEDGRG
ncbi:MAG TPA: MlaD family protein [Actinomycetota bacterium]|jgi:phospholipid/cholesterol/gamma-HCH transport system substrate-binding protein|nr:MlaD family protein [Actinomycetota bacterium]